MVDSHQLHLRMCTAIYSIVDLQSYLRIYAAFNDGLSVASSDVHCVSWLVRFPIATIVEAVSLLQN